jgi:hypothetical protein
LKNTKPEMSAVIRMGHGWCVCGRRVWEVFTSNRGLDRHALLYLLLPWTQDIHFPPPKPKRSSYEWYSLKGKH